jgi:hypothetical protein
MADATARLAVLAALLIAMEYFKAPQRAALVCQVS